MEILFHNCFPTTFCRKICEMQLYLTLVIVWSQLAPAPGEIVAAIYPPDGQWYRAMVISLTNHDQSVEVRIYYSQRTLKDLLIYYIWKHGNEYPERIFFLSTLAPPMGLSRACFVILFNFCTVRFIKVVKKTTFFSLFSLLISYY